MQIKFLLYHKVITLEVVKSGTPYVMHVKGRVQMTYDNDKDNE